MSAVAIDFESFYSKDCNISTLGSWHYLNDPRCDIYLAAVVGDGVEFVGRPEEFDWRCLNGKFVVAHNLAWDGLVFSLLQTKGVIPGGIAFAGVGCTANLSVFLGGPRHLAGAAKQLLGTAVSKDIRTWMKGRTWQDAVDAGRADELREYALRDARTCLAIWERYSADWPEHERALARQTMLSGWRGFRVDRQRVDAGIAHLERVKFDAARLIPWADSDAAILSPKALGEACRAAGIKPPPSLSEDDPACEEWERTHGELYPWVRAMRDWRKSNALLEKLKTMRARTRPSDGCMGYGLKYFGAATGRWSGDAGYNIQNLPRGESYGVDLRGCIIPRPGFRLVTCDLAQIEPRCLAWLCGDQAFLDQIAGGIPLYEAHARNTMGWRGGNLKKEDPRLYSLAKARVLGLGYGCGPDKFRAIAKTMCGLEIGEREAQETVAAFRGSNRAIIGLWNRLQTDCRRSAGGTFEIELPSGRRLSYFNIRSAGGWTFQTELGGPVQRFYGGRLAENLVQATARDVFAEGLLRVERAGFQILFHCHDEVVCEVPDDSAPAAAEEIARLMTTPPDWMPGIPLEAETQVSDRYAK
jgi:hypothetical protein